LGERRNENIKFIAKVEADDMPIDPDALGVVFEVPRRQVPALFLIQHSDFFRFTHHYQQNIPAPDPADIKHAEHIILIEGLIIMEPH
jgi:hypothetical protein